jgi:hypothetical protein
LISLDFFNVFVIIRLVFVVIFILALRFILLVSLFFVL